MNLLSTTDVSRRVRLSKATLWRLRQRYSDFPKPILINGTPRWVAEEIDDWFLSKRVQKEEGRS